MSNKCCSHYGECYTCVHFENMGIVNFHIGTGYDGRCKVDEHDTDSYVYCKIGQYKQKGNGDLEDTEGEET